MTSIVQIKKLIEIADIIDSLHQTPREYTKIGYPMVRVTDISGGYLNFKKAFKVDEDTYNVFTRKYKPQVGDLIFSRVGSYGNISYVKTEENFCLGQNVALIHPKINSKFLYYYLISKQAKYQIESMVVGSTQKTVSLKNISNLKIFTPNEKTQQKIAKVLSAIDDKIELNNSINNNLEQQAQAIFNNKFVNLETVPSNWQIGNLSDIADYLNGLAMQKFRPSEDEIGIPVLKIKELRQGFCDNQSDLCSPNIKSEYLINNGDVIFSWSGTLWLDLWCSGLCGLNQHLFKVTSLKYDKWFYYFWTKYHMNKFIAIATDKATTMGHIKREDLDKSEVLIPDNKTYKQLNSILSLLINLIIKNRVENRQLAQLRDTLLPKLMNGEIDVSKVEIDDILENQSADKLYEPANESKLSAEPYNSSGSFASASKNLTSEQSSSADKLLFSEDQ